VSGAPRIGLRATLVLAARDAAARLAWRRRRARAHGRWLPVALRWRRRRRRPAAPPGRRGGAIVERLLAPVLHLHFDVQAVAPAEPRARAGRAGAAARHFVRHVVARSQATILRSIGMPSAAPPTAGTARAFRGLVPTLRAPTGLASFPPTHRHDRRVDAPVAAPRRHHVPLAASAATAMPPERHLIGHERRMGVRAVLAWVLERRAMRRARDARVHRMVVTSDPARTAPTAARPHARSVAAPMSSRRPRREPPAFAARLHARLERKAWPIMLMRPVPTPALSSPRALDVPRPHGAPIGDPRPSAPRRGARLDRHDHPVDLVWRAAARPAPSAALHGARADDMPRSSRASGASAPATNASPAGSVQRSRTAPGTITQLDPALLERVADDVIRRVERRARIERERRGL
jgi:hypothetical protein